MAPKVMLGGGGGGGNGFLWGKKKDQLKNRDYKLSLTMSNSVLTNRFMSNNEHM